MNINIDFLIDDDQQLTPEDLSSSIARMGTNAGRITWNNSLEVANGRKVEGFNVDAAKRWAGEFGAWEREDIARWSRKETLALVLQYLAGDINEARSVCPGDGVAGIDWAEYEKLSQAGTIGGSLYVHEGKLWASID